MSLATVSDAFLASRVRAGDEVAFAELARRYRPLVVHVSVGAPRGIDAEDLRQEALLGLAAACAAYDRAKGSFAAFASRTVRWQTGRARQAARRYKHGVLSNAVVDGDEPLEQLVMRMPASAGSDPARVVELRDELRQRITRQQRERREGRRRGYTVEQVEQALAMISAGRTVKQVALSFCAPRKTVHAWLRSAGVTPPNGRRRFTQAEIEQVLALLDQGVSQRQAGELVGAAPSTVMNWVRNARCSGRDQRPEAAAPAGSRHLREAA